MYKTISAAAISMKPTKWDKSGNANKLESLFTKAAEENPDLILAPEGVLEGYVVTDVINQPELGKEMLAISEPIDGIYINRFQKLAKQLGVCLCFGFAEKIGNEIYNTAIFIDGQGSIRGKYHKTQFAEGLHPTWYFNRIGKTIRAFNTPLGRVGFLICNDRWNPVIARTLVLDGAQLLLIPSYGSKDKKQNRAVLARARENGVPIVEANVGMNMLVSKGEIVAYKWGNDMISTGTIHIPTRPSTYTARAYENKYMSTQEMEMHTRYEHHSNLGRK